VRAPTCERGTRMLIARWLRAADDVSETRAAGGGVWQSAGRSAEAREAAGVGTQAA